MAKKIVYRARRQEEVAGDTAKILLTFSNFRIIPGEVIPYYVLRLRTTRTAGLLFYCTLILLLIKLLIVSLSESSVEFFAFLTNGFECLIVIYLLGLPRRSAENEKQLIKIVVSTSLALYVVVAFLPELENIRFLLLDRDVSYTTLQEFERGFPFLAPEPSYAGVFFVGLFILGQQIRLPKFWLASLILCIALTASIWALGLLILHLIAQIRFTIQGALTFVIILIGVFYPLTFVPILEMVGPRLVQVANFVAQEGPFQAIILLEERFGSSRLGPTLETYQRFDSFTETKFIPTYSFFAQNISVFGTILGSIVNLSVLMLVLYNLGLGGLRYAWILVVVGPVVLPTNYLAMRSYKPDRSIS